ncbi:MAG TPA: GntR family transcriptional regulator [Actinomycetaceae bacterium]|nr:GntR family transcriptional regulator [Actinomycetaceae bacterium]
MSEFDDRTPIYQQIAGQIRRDILSGELEEENQVMSTTQYATTYRINPATAAKAMNLLVDDGLLIKRRGIGMFVASGARESLRSTMRGDYFTDTLDPALEEAELLGIPRSALVDYINREQK